MGRYPRPHLPGAPFHITARLQNRAHLFTPDLRGRVVDLLARQLSRSDVRLLAYVVMTNHLHLVLIQGQQPLGRFMQPLLRSAALATQRAHGLEGHVFERRFHDRYCRDADHLRSAIAYTHANPVRAGICAEPADYAWSSHHQYLPGPVVGGRVVVDVGTGLSAFAEPGAPWPETAPAAYADFLAGILCSCGDEGRSTSGVDAVARVARPARNGDGVAAPDADARHAIPLAEITRRVLADSGDPFPAHALKSRRGPRSRLRIRARVAIEASRSGYSGREIARFLEISEPTVSRILAAGRQQHR